MTNPTKEHINPNKLLPKLKLALEFVKSLRESSLNEREWARYIQNCAIRGELPMDAFYFVDEKIKGAYITTSKIFVEAYEALHLNRKEHRRADPESVAFLEEKIKVKIFDAQEKNEEAEKWKKLLEKFRKATGAITRAAEKRKDPNSGFNLGKTLKKPETSEEPAAAETPAAEKSAEEKVPVGAA